MGTRRRRSTVRAARQRRHARVRRKVRGSAARPRLSVFRSNGHIYCQVIDDDAQRTLAAASDLEQEVRQRTGMTKSERATLVGTKIADRAGAAGVKQVVFDRGAFQYHGRVRALADAARTGGLDF